MRRNPFWMLLSGVCALALSCDPKQEKDGEQQAVRGTSVATKPSVGTGGIDSHNQVAKVKHMALRPTEFSLAHFDAGLRKRSVREQQDYLLSLLEKQVKLSPTQMQKARELVGNSSLLSFGNPEVSEPTLSQEECVARWKGRAPHQPDPKCGKPNMVIVAGSEGEICVDQFEFPNLQCEYPVVWVRAAEAASLCELQGKRLCDAHEWEGACAGTILPRESEYLHGKLPRGEGPEYRRNRRLLMEDWHNRPREVVWAYGSTNESESCGTGGRKSPGCGEVTYQKCGTNNYPAGSFPGCVSKGGVYDQHGNVAEHMSLPLFPDEFGGAGWTEMKGSWFISTDTHPNDCRWRAKNWHTTKVSDPNSHNNYHLGFRCCTELAGAGQEDPAFKRE